MRKPQWWKRAEWALDRALDEDDDRAAIGLAVLEYLAGSKLAGPDEAAMLEAAWAGLLDTVEPMADDEGTQFRVTMSEEDTST